MKGKRPRWHLLIDYDRLQDIPGATIPGPFWAQEGEVLVIELTDGPPDVDLLFSILEARLARSGYGIEAWDFRASTNGWHAKVRLDGSPGPMESVALQAVCGSDPSRESCNVQRARVVESATADGGDAAEFWSKRWNVLYAPNPQRKVTR